MKPNVAKNFLLTVFLFCLTHTFGQTSQQLENAVAFSNLYGYVKYFHPSDEAASIDWNRFAIYSSKRVSVCKNTAELKETLSELFKPIAPTLLIFSNSEKVGFNKDAVMPAENKDYKTIAWQHLGVGVSERESIYRSARTNRPITIASTAPTFAPANSLVNAEPLQGKEFIFTGRLRLAKGDGQAQLWTRVDRANKKMGFFDNMGNRPVKNKDWGTYEIKGTVDSDAANMFIGVMLVGKGVIEFDDLSLKVKEGDAWKELYTNTFTDSEEGKAPKNLGFNTASPYYTIAAKKEGNNNSFASINSLEAEAKSKPHDTLFKQYPQVGEYVEKSIGAGLKVILPLALYGTETQTFPAADSMQLKTLKEKLQELTPTEMSANNLYTRLGDLAITWNVFEHFYPYFDIVKTDWNTALRQAVERSYQDKNESDFLKTLQLLTAKLKDGHVRVNSPANKSVYAPLLTWEWIEGELIITNISDTALALKRGDIVKEINNQSSKEYFAAIYPTISAATKGWLDYRAQTESLLGEKGSAMKLKIVHADKTTDEVDAIRNATLSQYYAALPIEDSIKTLADGMMYVNIGVASMETINKALPQLKNSAVIICDLRGYPNNNHDFINYLLTKNDTSKQWMQVAQTIYPDRERTAGWQKYGWELKPAKTHLNGKIVFIIDGQAISYAESYMSFIENYKLATIIGQPTAGTNGNVNPFTIPGNYYISWTGMKVQKHNGTTHHGVGILPDILVNKTIKGVQEGRDEFLEKAIEVGRKLL